jgi:hypothetical protein
MSGCRRPRKREERELQARRGSRSQARARRRPEIHASADLRRGLTEQGSTPRHRGRDACRPAVACARAVASAVGGRRSRVVAPLRRPPRLAAGSHMWLSRLASNSVASTANEIPMASVGGAAGELLPQRAGEQLAHPTAEASVLSRAAAERSLPLPPDLGLHDPTAASAPWEGRGAPPPREGEVGRGGGRRREGEAGQGGRRRRRRSSQL